MDYAVIAVFLGRVVFKLEITVNMKLKTKFNK